MIRFLLILLIFPIFLASTEESEYVPVKDPLVQKSLEQWQDLKFGLFMHWGHYCQWGVVESWSVCNEDWINRRCGRYENYHHYKEDYWNLKKTFNPTGFKPDPWVKAAKQAGMKYLVFTTKHHDGFCMFDTKTTDNKITSKECPFHTHVNANVTKVLFDAFRNQGFKIGAYFSKPDWSHKDFWWPYKATPDRHVNYDPAKHPEKWERFKKFTFDQIQELMTNYGKVDILWLDGAWVRPFENMPEEYEWWAKKKEYNQDIDIPAIAKMARTHQPGLIFVDRWVSGLYENYLTPEQKVPEKALSCPWESCITMAPGWSYNKNHKYKSVRKLIHLLVDIVSKGGNFLLNIGPSPEGDWAPDAYDRLKGIGDWMRVNSQAIYETRPIAPFKDGKVCLTQNRNTKAIYAIYLAAKDETLPPPMIWLNSLQPAKGSKIHLLGYENPLQWEKVGKGCVFKIPESVQKNPPCEHAWVIKMIQ